MELDSLTGTIFWSFNLIKCKLRIRSRVRRKNKNFRKYINSKTLINLHLLKMIHSLTVLFFAYTFYYSFWGHLLTVYMNCLIFLNPLKPFFAFYFLFFSWLIVFLYWFSFILKLFSHKSCDSMWKISLNSFTKIF